MKRLLDVAAGSLVLVFGVARPASTQAIRTIPASYARGEHQIVTVALYPGNGTTLNFRPTGETIYRAWLDDPSQVTLDFDDPRCSAVEASRECAASVIHLRRINPLNFPNLPSTSTTSLTILTDRELYKFQLTFPGAGSPSYYALEIWPDPPPLPLRSPLSQIAGEAGAQFIARGMQMAQSRQLLREEDALWNRLQAFLALLQRGIPAETAAVQAGISPALVVRLFEMGSQTRSF